MKRVSRGCNAARTNYEFHEKNINCVSNGRDRDGNGDGTDDLCLHGV